MANLSKMNGKPFTHFTFVHFQGHARKLEIGRHTSADAAFRNYYRNDLLKRYGDGKNPVWIEDLAGKTLEIPDKREVNAKHRAEREGLKAVGP